MINLAFSLKTEWGENYGKPINERILVFYPKINPDEITELTKLACEAESFIYDLAEQELTGNITETEVIPNAEKRFSWLDSINAGRLKNIGMFYERK